MQIEITEDGNWTDAEGKRWRLVPMAPSTQQNNAALAKAERWGMNGQKTKALAWDYVQGYFELVEHAPRPTLTHNS